MKHIALTGPMYSGKSTLARALQQEGYLLANFTDLLKQYAVDALQAVRTYTTIEKIKQDKARYRTFLQGLGTVIGFDTEEKYVVEALYDWFGTGQQECVFDNPRTISQVNALKRLGFSLVGLTLPRQVQTDRAYALGVDRDTFERMLNHPVERGISPDLFDLTLDATKPIETNIKFLLGDLPLSELKKRIA